MIEINALSALVVFIALEYLAFKEASNFTTAHIKIYGWVLIGILTTGIFFLITQHILIPLSEIKIIIP